MTDVWISIATQIPYVAALALVVLLLRRSETEERHANQENWQAFLVGREEKWQTYLTGMQNATNAVNTALINELSTVSKQMQAVTMQVLAVQVAVEHFSALQEYNTNEMREMREFMRKNKGSNDNQQPRNT